MSNIKLAQMKQSVNGFYDREIVQVTKENQATLWVSGYGRRTEVTKIDRSDADMNPVISRDHRGRDYMHRLMGLFSWCNPIIYHEYTEGQLAVILRRKPDNNQDWYTLITMTTQESGARDIGFTDYGTLELAQEALEDAISIPF